MPRRLISWGQSHSTAMREPGSNSTYLHSSSSSTVIAMDLTGCRQLWAKDTAGDIDSHSSPAHRPRIGPGEAGHLHRIRGPRTRPDDGRGDLGVQARRRQHL
ncbi:hypothetical protein AB0N06_23380 [Streptomyces sp. NPDC051020]|uniref:hypothetical protein n=1 Tax=Streptomyces sp. NPDC051020 TaxID=3155409 RepID=UPI00343EEB5A